MNHFTNKEGFDGIRSQPTWLFKAVQPRQSRHPVGAYFTTFGPDEPNLSKKLFIPKTKREFVFSFVEPIPLKMLEEKRGEVHQIYYSPTDYHVPRAHQSFHGHVKVSTEQQ
ncbi:hypothetical protein WME91_12560 [Sorangium sp. So ce269]